MTPPQIAKQHGITLNEVVLMVGKPRATLRNWHRDSPVLFEAVIAGCAIIKQQRETKNEE